MIRWLLRLSDAARHLARARRGPADQAAGRRGEDLAHRYLERRGLRVVGRNYRPPGGGGEVDLVAWEGDTLVFVEVKARHTDASGAPERNIGEAKRVALQRAARAYARRAGVDWERVRFDVVSVLLTQPPDIRHVRDAIRPSGKRK
ncbi:MAG: YraN family protein [Bryobacteraceae bacterium]